MAANENKKKGPGIKDQLRSKYFKAGSYSILASLIVIVIAIVVNIIMNSVPVKYTKLDMTQNSLYSISDETKNIVSGLAEDVEIYWIVRTGFEDPVVENLLNNYADLSSHIKLIKKDPDINPGFMQEYAQSYTDNSIIVKKGEKSRYIDGNDLYIFDDDAYYYYYYYGQEMEPTGFDGESLITAAIDYCIRAELPKMYVLTGHGELSLTDSFREAVTKRNVEVEDISLITYDAVPEDADIILIDSPLSDISSEEMDKIKQYMAAGGNVIILMDVVENSEPLTNITAFLGDYGLSLKRGYVCESDPSNYAYNTPYYLLPNLGTHDITSVIKNNGYYVFISLAEGIGISDTLPEGVTVDTLLSTSNGGYIKDPMATTLEYEQGDEAGTIPLAVAVTKTVNETVSSKMLLVGTSTILDDDLNQVVSGGNEDFFLNTIEWMTADSGKAGNYSIHAKSFTTEYLTIKESTAGFLRVLLIGVIPLAYIIVGIVVVIKRRRK